MNSRQEAYANNRIQGMKPKEAYIAAGYSATSAPKQSSRLENNEEVKRKIEEGKARAKEIKEKSCGLTEKYVVVNLMINVSKALEAGKYQAVATSLALLGKHLGMFIDRSEVTITGETMQFLEKIIGIIDSRVKDKKTRGLIMGDLADMNTLKDD